MDARNLEAKMRDCLAKMHAAEASIAALQMLLIEAKSQRDPLASHICASRREVRQVSMTDNHKHRRPTNSTLSMTYRTAATLGYRGTEYDWEKLMFAGEKKDPPPESSTPEVRSTF